MCRSAVPWSSVRITITLGRADWADPEWPARADAVAQEIARIAIVPAASFPNRIMFSCNSDRHQILRRVYRVADPSAIARRHTRPS